MASITLPFSPVKVGTIWHFPTAVIKTNDGKEHYAPPFQFRTVGDNKEENHFFGLNEALSEEDKIKECLKKFAQLYEDGKVVGVNFSHGEAAEQLDGLTGQEITL